MSAYQLSQLIFEVPTGVIADRYGNKKSVLLSIVCNLISLSIYIYLSDYISYIIAIIIFGIGQTLVSGALDALIIDKVQEDKQSKCLCMGKFHYTNIILCCFWIEYISCGNYCNEKLYISF